MKFLIFIMATSVFAQDFTRSFKFPGEGKWSNSTRSNIFELQGVFYDQAIEQGKKHALVYPVDVTGLLIPFDLFKKSFNLNSGNQIQKLVKKVLRKGSGFRKPDDFYKWMGLNNYPRNPYQKDIPRTHEWTIGLPMGATLMERYGVDGITFGCAACHSGTLFGQPVLGMSNRFVKANEVFSLAKMISPLMIDNLTSVFSEASPPEIKMLSDINQKLKRVRSKVPEIDGLDTSSYQVGVSLYYLSRDPYASNPRYFIPDHPFETKKYFPESKPAPWWNLKYKTKWLLDGSVISGNPIATNIIWNELGRGTDLKEVERWMKENPKIIKDLTASVFATKAPRYEDFFGVKSIDISKAKKGEKLFVKNCQKCHGSYLKNWNNPQISDKSLALKNEQIKYHRVTPVIDVGTDSDRFKSGKFIAEELNRLNVLKEFGIVVKKQNGYIPPPLEGIWARWPYFHNNAAPSLCAVLTVSHLRPKFYYAGQPIHKDKDFDQQCNGYPLASKAPSHWKKKERQFNTYKRGLRNTGHDKGILLDKNGNEKFSKNQKLQIIEFLKTL